MPPKRKRYSSRSHEHYEFDDSNNNYNEFIDIPNPDDSGESDGGSDDEDLDENSDQDTDIEDVLAEHSYKKISKTYTDNQKKLENEHLYEWVSGEKKYDSNLQNEFLLGNAEKAKIRGPSPVELLELFLPDDMKNYIIEATNDNAYNLTKIGLKTFLGVIILSSIRGNLREITGHQTLYCLAI